MNRNVFATVLLFVSLLSHEVLAEDLTPGKRADIRAFLQITGGGNLAQQFAALATRDLVIQLRNRPGFTAKHSQAVQEEMVSIYNEGLGSAGALSEKIEDVYGKYYTHQEIKELLTFFRSPIGQKFTGSAKGLSRDIINAGLAWSNSIAPTIDTRLRNRLKKEGFELPASNANQKKNSSTPVEPAATPSPAKE